MSAVPTNKKRAHQSGRQDPARHSGVGRNPVRSLDHGGETGTRANGGAIPTNAPLGDLCEPRVSQDGPKERGEFVYVDIGSIDRETKLIVEPKTIAAAQAPSRAKQLLKAGDVVVSMTRPNLNAVAMIPPELDGAIGSTGFHVLRAKDAEPGFLFYAVQTPAFVDAMTQKVQGALYPAVRPKDISEFCIPRPSKTEQQRVIAEIEKQFTRLEAGVAALRRVQANLKRYRAAVLKAACEGRLVPTEAELARTEGRTYETGEQLLARILADRRKNWHGRGKYKEPDVPDTTNLPPLPEGWAWATPAQISSAEPHALAIGPFGSNLKVSDYKDVGVPLIFVRNIRSSQFGGKHTSYISVSKARELQAHHASKGDILVTKMGEPPGDACLYPDSEPDAVITADCIKLRLASIFEEKRFFVHVINSEVVKSRIRLITKGVAQMKVSLGRFSSLPVPMPPLAEQTRIVAEVERRLSIVEELEAAVAANLQRAARLRQAILQRAFVGRGP